MTDVRGANGRLKLRDGLITAWAAPAAAFLVAAISAGCLSIQNAPRPDEFHTLAYVRSPSLRALWTSYHGAVDATPPLAYAWSWIFARILGTGLLGVRLPFVGCRAIAAAALAVATREAKPAAAFAAGIVPTATALVYLGAYARPYSPALAASSVALVCWHQLGGDEKGSHRAWTIALALSCGAAVAMHYATAVMVAILSGIAWSGGRGTPRRRARWIAPLIGSGVSLLASAVVAKQAIAAPRSMVRSVRLADAVAFWPSAVRPAWPLITVVAAVLVAMALSRRSERVSRHDSDLVLFGGLVVTIVPVATVAAMAATSVIYFHRYGLTATLGAGCLLAAVAGGGDHRRQAGAALVAGLLVLSCVLATADVARWPGRDRELLHYRVKRAP